MATLKNTAINDTGYLQVPAGTTAQRPPSPVLGDFRYNTEEEALEVYNGTAWKLITGGGDPEDFTAINAVASMVDIAYAPMPSGPRTLLNYVNSFGLNGSSSNDGGTTWTNGFGVESFTTVSTGSYFLSGVWRIFAGDGTADAADWVLWNFGPTGGGDFNPDVTAAGSAFFGGEFADQSAATNNGVASTAYIWGFDGSSWKLLWQYTTGGGQSYGHPDSRWYNSGSTVTSGNGKRTEYDTLAITHLGFSVS